MSAATKKRRIMRLSFYAGVIGTLVILMLGWWAGNADNLAVPGDRLIAIGRLFGLFATWCVILQIILMSRIPFMERNFDLQDSIDLHRLNGYGLLFSVSAHVVFLVLGYSLPTHNNIWSQFIDFNTSYEDVLLGTIGTIVFFVAAALSVYIIRSRLRYEVWYTIHLTIYIAILLTFLHQIKTGGDFVNNFIFTAYWYGLYIFAFILWAWYRVARPFYFLMRYQLRVSSVEKVANSIYCVTVSGRDLAQFNFTSGQYATWRILMPGLWFEAHPFSFSGTSGSATLQFTVKASGDFTDKISRLQPGAFVLLDGPRGNFDVERAADSTRVVMIAGGIGITPYMAMIETFLRQGKHTTLLYAVRSAREVAFADELRRLQLLGLHIELYVSEDGRFITDLELQAIKSEDTTVYICGPDRMSRSFSQSLSGFGFPKSNIIVERFAF